MKVLDNYKYSNNDNAKLQYDDQKCPYYLKLTLLVNLVINHRSVVRGSLLPNLTWREDAIAIESSFIEILHNLMITYHKTIYTLI